MSSGRTPLKQQAPNGVSLWAREINFAARGFMGNTEKTDNKTQKNKQRENTQINYFGSSLLLRMLLHWSEGAKNAETQDNFQNQQSLIIQITGNTW